MKYSKTKKQKFSIFAIVYSLVIMLAVLQFGGIIFNTGVLAIDEWNTTVKPTTGISIIENSSSKTTMLVSTPAAFDYALYYASNPTSTVDLTIELVNSINMSAKYIKPKNITNSKLTKLTIIGHGNTISGLKYSTAVDNCIGLISYIDRPLLVEGLNLRVDSTKITTNAVALGALIGVTHVDDVRLTKCAIYGKIECNNIQYDVGGLIGCTDTPIQIDNCWSYCTIEASTYNNSVGGLVGAFRSNTTVTNCANFEGKIKSTENSSVGGLFGIVFIASEFSKCFNNAKIENRCGATGGLVGWLYATNAKVNDCYNNADLSCEDTEVGGLVGRGESGLEFNRCYSNGELRKIIDTTLIEDTNYTNREIVTYKVSGDFSDIEKRWDYNCNINFGIQNGGGSDPEPPLINDIHLGISKIEKINNICLPNLCGNDIGVYNSSFCKNNYNFGYDNIYENIAMRIQTKFTYNNNTSHVMDRFTYKIKTFYDFSFDSIDYRNPAAILYEFVHGGENQHLIDKMYEVLTEKERDILNQYPETLQIRTDGIYPCSIDNGTRLKMAPIIEIFVGYAAINLENIWFEDPIYSVTIDLPQIVNNTSLVSNTGDIKLDILNSGGNQQYVSISSINDGLPILKDFYWEYSV